MNILRKIKTKVKEFCSKLHTHFKQIRELVGSHVFLLFFAFVVYIILGDLYLSKNLDEMSVHVYIYTGLTFLMLWFAVFISSLKKILNLKTKQEQDKLSYKIASIISSNIDHQLQSPLLAIKSSFDDIQSNLNKLIKLASPVGNRAIDKLIYGCREDNKEICKKCTLKYDCHKNKSLIEEIITDSKEINAAIENMKETLSILKGNRKQQEKTPTNLYDVINDAVLTYRMLHKYKVVFDVDVRFRNFEVSKSNAVNLVNVFANHINNSLDAHAYIVKFKYVDYKDGLITLYIIDDGDGIDPKDINTVWEYKKTTKGDGRGFGMFFCKQIIKTLGGDERIVATKKGSGTVLEIKFPAKRLKK